MYLRSIATSANKHMLEKNIEIFKNSEIWKQSRCLQQYFTEYWQPHMEVFMLFVKSINMKYDSRG